jgi:hypothetical protein
MATLKISDLSVGDWVEIDHEVFGWQPAQINVCGDLGIGAYFKDIDPEEEYDCTLSQARPIPITAEILEKNGFVKKNYDNGKMWDWWCDNVLVRKYADEDIYRFIVALNSMHYTTTMVVGKHTHQLQHALRLAGVDKEINL